MRKKIMFWQTGNNSKVPLQIIHTYRYICTLYSTGQSEKSAIQMSHCLTQRQKLTFFN